MTEATDLLITTMMMMISDDDGGAGDGGEEEDDDDFEEREEESDNVYKGKQSHYEQQHVNDRSHFSLVSDGTPSPQ